MEAMKSFLKFRLKSICQDFVNLISTWFKLLIWESNFFLHNKIVRNLGRVIWNSFVLFISNNNFLRRRFLANFGWCSGDDNFFRRSNSSWSSSSGTFFLHAHSINDVGFFFFLFFYLRFFYFRNHSFNTITQIYIASSVHLKVTTLTIRPPLINFF